MFSEASAIDKCVLTGVSQSKQHTYNGASATPKHHSINNTGNLKQQDNNHMATTALITNKQQQHTGSDSNSTNEYTHICIYVYIWCVCIYIYIHIHTHKRTYTRLKLPSPFPATPARLQQWKQADASAEATGTGAAESCTERGLNTLMDFPSGSSSGCHHRFVIDAPVMDAVFAGIGTASSHASFLRVVPDADARKPKYS